MTMKQKVIISWSGGKDSALALYQAKKNKDHEIASLLTTVTKDYDRISMHGVRQSLLEKQSACLGLPLNKVFISKSKSNREYESKMKNFLLGQKAKGVSSIVFGDVFLEDLRLYRENNLKKVGLQAFFPLWKTNTSNLAKRFIDLGFKAIITCVDSRVLSKDFVGREFNQQFLADLPPSIDPCGENGEFHSFVYAGPICKQPIACKIGKIVLKDNRFYYCDLEPVE